MIKSSFSHAKDPGKQHTVAHRQDLGDTKDAHHDENQQNGAAGRRQPSDEPPSSQDRKEIKAKRKRLRWLTKHKPPGVEGQIDNRQKAGTMKSIKSVDPLKPLKSFKPDGQLDRNWWQSHKTDFLGKTVGGALVGAGVVVGALSVKALKDQAHGFHEQAKAQWAGANATSDSAQNQGHLANATAASAAQQGRLADAQNRGNDVELINARAQERLANTQANVAFHNGEQTANGQPIPPPPQSAGNTSSTTGGSQFFPGQPGSPQYGGQGGGQPNQPQLPPPWWYYQPPASANNPNGNNGPPPNQQTITPPPSTQLNAQTPPKAPNTQQQVVPPPPARPQNTAAPAAKRKRSLSKRDVGRDLTGRRRSGKSTRRERLRSRTRRRRDADVGKRGLRAAPVKRNVEDGARRLAARTHHRPRKQTVLGRGRAEKIWRRESPSRPIGR